jgi:hypothetical protein
MKPLVLLVAAALFMLPGPKCLAQKVFFTSIALDSRASVSGFLHSVTDSSVIIVPAQRRKDLANINQVPPLAVPIKEISHMVTWRVRGQGTVLLQIAAMSAMSTSTTVFAVNKFGARWAIPGSFMTNVALVLGYAEITNTRLTPEDVFFREKVEDKCIYKDERSIVASAAN